MRHNKKFNHLGRQRGHRRAMLANMATSLILHKRINTTLAKAKALRMYVEPLITKSKDDSTHSRREVFSHLQSKEAVSELFREVSPKVGDRPGGYTRILKTGTRMGDAADMCIIELVDFNENLLAAKEGSAKASKSRRRRGGKKKADAPAAETAKAVVEEAIVEEAIVEETKAEEKIEETPVAQAAPEVEDKKEDTASTEETQEDKDKKE